MTYKNELASLYGLLIGGIFTAPPTGYMSTFNFTIPGWSIGVFFNDLSGISVTVK